MAIQPIVDDGSWGDLKGLVDLINGIFGTEGSTSTTSSLPSSVQGILDMLTHDILPGLKNDQTFSPEKASEDSAALMKQAMQDFANFKLPDIYQAQSNAGAYNSTTGQLLANDAETSAASKAAASAADLKLRYGTQRQTQIDSIMKLVMSLAASLRNTNTTTTTGQTSGKGKLAAGLGALAGLGKDRGKPTPGAKPKNIPSPNPNSGSPTASPVDDGREDNQYNDPLLQEQAMLSQAEKDAGLPGPDYGAPGQPGSPEYDQNLMNDILNGGGGSPDLTPPPFDLSTSPDQFGDAPPPDASSGNPDPFAGSTADVSGDSGTGNDFGGGGDLPVNDWWNSLFGDTNSSSGNGFDFSSLFGDMFATDAGDNVDFTFDTGNDFSGDPGFDFQGDSGGDYSGYGGA